MFLATIVGGILRWGLILVLVKLPNGNSLELVGLWTLAQAITLPVMFVTDLNLQTVFITDVERKYSIGHFIGLRLITSFAMILIVAFIGIWDGYSTYKLAIVVLFSINIAVLSFRTLLLSINIRNEFTKPNMISSFSISLLAFLFFSLAMYTTGNLIIGFGALLTARILVLILYDFRKVYQIENEFNGTSLKEFIPKLDKQNLKLLWLAFPLGASVAILSICNNLPIYFLQKYGGDSSVGLYGGLNIFVAGFNILLTPLFSSIGPRLSKSFNENIKDFIFIVKNISGIFLIGGSIIATGTYFFGSFFLPILLSEKYQGYSSEFTLIMISAALWICWALFNYVLQTARYFWVLVVFNSFILLVSAIFSNILIKKFILLGAVYSRLATTILGFVLIIPVLYFVIKKNKHKLV